nr:hypothetical protein HmN_000975200 [Hymenolepis microstoma]
MVVEVVLAVYPVGPEAGVVIEGKVVKQGSTTFLVGTAGYQVTHVRAARLSDHMVAIIVVAVPTVIVSIVLGGLLRRGSRMVPAIILKEAPKMAFA